MVGSSAKKFNDSAYENLPDKKGKKRFTDDQINSARLLKSQSKVALGKGDSNQFLSESDETVTKRNVMEISKKITNKLADLLKESERAA